MRLQQRYDGMWRDMVSVLLIVESRTLRRCPPPPRHGAIPHPRIVFERCLNVNTPYVFVCSFVSGIFLRFNIVGEFAFKNVLVVFSARGVLSMLETFVTF